MFNKPPKFLTSTDVIDIVDNIPKVEKVKKEPVSTVPVNVVETKPETKSETKHETFQSFVTDPIEEKKPKTKSNKKLYKYSGDDIPWLY